MSDSWGQQNNEGWGQPQQPQQGQGWGAPPPPPPPPQGGGFPQQPMQGGFPQQGYPQQPMGMGPNGPMMMSTEHPDGTKALIISILGLLCCGPLAIWSFLISKNAKAEGSTDSKINIAYIISIIALVFFVIAVIGNLILLATGAFTFETQTYNY